jgi:hypothetical protein
MTYKDQIAGLGETRWSIPLATHLRTDLENETSAPVLALPPRRQRTEERYVSLWKQRRPPIAGYNCFGHVFANRRTALYNLDVELVLAEDGFGRISGLESIVVGDIVIYSDETGPTHAARVERLERLEQVIVSPTEQGSNPPGPIPIVLSKFDDVSGEYEHPLEDYRWDQGQITYCVYRDRHVPPSKKPAGWRDRISTIES